MNIHPPVHDDVVYLGMLCLGVASPMWLVSMLFIKRSSAGLVILAMLCGSGWLAMHGHLLDTEREPPTIALLVATSLAVVIWLGTAGRRRWITPLAGRSALTLLLLSQTFRLPLELIMLRAANSQIMPWEFSARGYNLDLITGLSALSLALVVMRRKRGQPMSSKALWLAIAAWNAWGVISLIVIMALAVMTSPGVHAFGNNAASINSWVLFFPYVWLPVVLVPTAVLGHLLSTWWLLENRPVDPGAA
jgi:hypothetical protein